MDKNTSKYSNYYTPEGLAGLFPEYREAPHTILGNYVAPTASTEEVKNILVYTNQIHWQTSPFESALCMATELQAFGYHVVFCLDKQLPSKIFPRGLTVCVLPSYSMEESSFRNRIDALARVVKTHNIDTAILCAMPTYKTYWDLLGLHAISLDQNQRRERVLLALPYAFMKPQFTKKSNWLRNTTPLVAHFDGLVVKSEVDATFWGAYHPRVLYRPLPLNLGNCAEKDNAPRIQSSSPTVVCLDHFSRQKNQLALINTFALVVQQIPQARLILAGENVKNYREKCEARVRLKGLEHAVLIQDALSANEQEQLLQNATLAVSTSVYDDVSPFLAQAMGTGLPVAAFALPCFPLLSGGETSGVLTVAQNDINGLAEYIIRILENVQLQSTLSAAAHKYAIELNSFDYQAFWVSSFKTLRQPTPTLEAHTIRQRIDKSLFDALFYASKVPPKDNTTLHGDKFSQENLTPLDATLIAKEWGCADTAIIASQENLIGALATVGLAGSLRAPIVIVEPDVFSDTTWAELYYLGIKTAYLAGFTKGDTAKINNRVLTIPSIDNVQSVEALTLPQLSLASALAQHNRHADTVIINTHKSSKDAISISPYAWASQSPILFLDSDLQLPEDILAYIQDQGFKKAIILGGPKVMPPKVEKNLIQAGISAESITRLAGSNEYSTNQIINEWATGQLPNGTGGDKIYLYTHVSFQPELLLKPSDSEPETNWVLAFTKAALAGRSCTTLTIARQ